ncbi:ATP-binding protein [bacterium]|nr:ATP-binding protein [bacterium]
MGPRQSGKSTLVRHLFPAYQYVSLETPDDRRLALEDPRGFFSRYSGSLIIDEVQRVPDLLSYIQTFVDEPGFKDHYVLTGSHQLLLMEKITQSLAGRTLIVKLLPFSSHEISEGNESKKSIDERMYEGGYPRIFDKHLSPQQWLEGYYQTYVERDVRELIKIDQLTLFERFMSLCSARVGQLINYSSLATDVGVSAPTVKSWLSMMEAGFICFSLAPYYKNLGKRVVKSPKLYFYDTGLLCYMLKIRTPQDLVSHALRGFIYENWVIVEVMKNYFNRGFSSPIYFWRDVHGHEVDLIIDKGENLYPIEIKSSQTMHSSFFKDLEYFDGLKNQKVTGIKGTCMYGGLDSYEYKSFKLCSWNEFKKKIPDLGTEL